MNKKGFTVVELAMVVVILGVLTGLVIKGIALYDSAKMRREMTKVSNFETALVGFYNFSGNLPGQESGQAWLDLGDMITGGFIKDVDLRSDLQPGRVWALYYCSETIGVGAWHIEGNPADNLLHVCAAVVDNYEAQNKFVCLMETVLDDSSTLHGKGRTTDSGGAGSFPGFYDNCSTRYYDDRDTSGYAWRVY